MGFFALDCTSLTELNVPDTSNITGIGDSFMEAFARGCTSLKSIGKLNLSSLTTVGDNFMSFFIMDCTSLTSIKSPNILNLTSVGIRFMYGFAYRCTSLTSIGIPNTSNITTFGNNFMTFYVLDCTALISLELSAIGLFSSNNINWSVSSGRLNNLKGYVQNETDLSDWQGVTSTGEILYTNYIRSTDNVILGLPIIWNFFTWGS